QDDSAVGAEAAARSSSLSSCGSTTFTSLAEGAAAVSAAAAGSAAAAAVLGSTTPAAAVAEAGLSSRSTALLSAADGSGAFCGAEMIACSTGAVALALQLPSHPSRS